MSVLPCLPRYNVRRPLNDTRSKGTLQVRSERCLHSTLYKRTSHIHKRGISTKTHRPHMGSWPLANECLFTLQDVSRRNTLVAHHSDTRTLRHPAYGPLTDHVATRDLVLLTRQRR